jgi:hypothetical protein
VVGVTPEDELSAAQTLMWVNDYSQLAVMTSPRGLKGAISWQSIAHARLTQPDATLRDCMIEPVVLAIDTPLLDAVRRVAESEYVFVRASDNTICGIVTTTDLSFQFGALAGPFLVLGEIERLLRVAIERVFPTDELAEAVSPDDDRIVDGAHSLTIGEIQRLIEEPSRWKRLAWPADRRVFNSALDEVRKVRNEVMHFSPDPLEADSLRRLSAFQAMLRSFVVKS